MDWFSIAIFAAFSSVTIFFAYYTIVFYFRNKKQSKAIFQLILDLSAMEDQFEKLNAEKTIGESEGFIRFISQSRDWAFEYIEDVQSKLNNFVEQVGPVMSYYDKYGRINENSSMNTIFEAYQELIKVLPEQTENKEK